MSYHEAEGKANKATASRKPPVAFDDVKTRVKEALRITKEYTFQQKDEYVDMLEDVVDDLDDQIDTLKENARELTAAAKQRLETQIAVLQAKREAVQERLDKAKSSTADAWSEIKKGMGNAVQDLQEAFGLAWKELR